MSNKDKKMLMDHIAEITRLMGEKDFVEVAERMSDDFFMVRPSGNPLKKSDWLNMVTSNDFEMLGSKLEGFNIVEVSDDTTMGYICYTTRTKFKYKGLLNDDVAVFASIFKREEDSDGWKMVFMQRSKGRKPSEPAPKFY